MSKARWSVLIFGPAPIVALSLAFTAWIRADVPTVVAANEVVEGDEATSASSTPEVNVFEKYPPAQSRKPAAVVPAEAPTRDCDRAAEALAKRLGEECAVIARAPFVIGGDMSREKLEAWHRDTIGPAARAMANTYFRTPPDRVITVLLFRGERSYDYYAKKLFDDEGVSVYGYYKPTERTLVMNIGTGGGTLVHELTHALMAFDFPKVPDWFNEGLASLHEQCDFRDGPDGPWIEGLENWRLPGLQKTIRAGKLRSLRELVNDDDFRGRLEGTNYAQARYFCLYMQRKGLLKEYFHKFHDSVKVDPRGEQAVRAVFPDISWDELDRDFQNWTLTLKRE